MTWDPSGVSGNDVLGLVYSGKSTVDGTVSATLNIAGQPTSNLTGTLDDTDTAALNETDTTTESDGNATTTTDETEGGTDSEDLTESDGTDTYTEDDSDTWGDDPGGSPGDQPSANAAATPSGSGSASPSSQSGTPPGGWSSPFWSGVGGFFAGAAQGIANTVNGVQDGVVGLANLPAQVYNNTAGYIGGGTIGYIPSPDWSQGLITAEDPTLHSLSKGLGGFGATTLATGPAVLGRLGIAAGTSNKMALVRQLGKEGEAAAAIVKNTQRIESISGTAAYRIPDGLTQTTLTEVKNVANLNFTNQLQDFLHFSIMTGREFVLVVRPTTQLSGPLQQAISAGWITLRFLP
jgi:hypothetical protein